MNFSSSHSAVVNPPVPGMVSIILLNWNGREFLQACLRSVHTQTYRHVELLIIDNCSTDGSRDLLLHDYNQYPLFLNETNLGYCGAANLGIRHAKGEYILLLNPDVILHNDFLSGLIEAAERDDTLGILTGKLLRFDKQTLDSTGQFLRSDLSPLERGYNERDTGNYDRPEAVFSTCGAVAFYRRTMLEDIQLEGEYFDESYFAFYEDLDIGWRAQLSGWTAYYVPDAVAYHYRGGGLKEQEQQKRWSEYFPFLSRASLISKPVFIQRHVIVNRYLTLLKNASWRDMLLGCPAIFKYEVLLWGYVVCMRPSLLSTLVDLVKLFPATMKKRRSIQSRKVVSSAYLRKYIRDSS